MPDAPARPLDLAGQYVEKTRRKRKLEADAKALGKEVDELAARLLDLVEQGELPAKFGINGASVFIREDTWASAKDGDHGNLTQVLSDLGLVEYLPSKVNSQAISAYVREHRHPETGEVLIGGDTGLDPRLAEALQITQTPKLVVQG